MATEYEEPQNAALRTQLGLRPAHYIYDEHEDHPDKRPCPPWCYINDVEYAHEVEAGRPLTAMHAYDVCPGVVASQYPGRFHKERGGDPAHVETATVECHLQQRGQDDPLIRVYLRQPAELGGSELTKPMRLSVTDAREVAALLTHLVQVAEGEAR